jgi:hypothetical protein
MTEQELRALVRDAIARHAADPSHLRTLAPSHPRTLAPSHASHVLFMLPAGDGPCLIEPAVACNHCGYCKSYGH